MLQYFKLQTSEVEDYPMIAGPSDSEGNTIGAGSPLVVRGLLACELFRPKFKEIPDHIYNMDNLLTVTHKAMCVINEFRLPIGASFHETDVYRKSRRKGSPIFKCYVVYFPEVFEFLDMEKSDKIPIGRHPAMVNVTKPVFPYRLIKDLDLFTNLYTNFVCSANLKRAIEENNLTNFKFTEVDVY